MIVPQQVRWPAPEYLHWQRLHEAVNEARERVSKAYVQMDEIDIRTDLSREDKRDERQRIAAQAIAEFEASRTLARAREALPPESWDDSERRRHCHLIKLPSITLRYRAGRDGLLGPGT